MKFWYKTFKIILKPFYKLYYNPKIYDKENLEVEGPVIYAANHIHLMDQCNIIINSIWELDLFLLSITHHIPSVIYTFTTQ